MRRLASLLVASVFLASAAPARADNVLAGVDLYQVLPTSTQSFTGPYEIPADFFAPGSLPFTSAVFMESPPIGEIPSCSLLPAVPVTAIRRTADAVFPGGETVPIELIQLSLVSVNPIMVIYDGGGIEQWKIDMTILPVPSGDMTIQHPAAAGGVFTAQFLVRPRFTFTRTDGPAPIRLFEPDVGAGEPWVIPSTPWVHAPPAGAIEVPGCTTNFFPGIVPDALAAANSVLPPFSPIGIEGPYTSLDCIWPSGSPTPARQTSWSRIKRLYR